MAVMQDYYAEKLITESGKNQQRSITVFKSGFKFVSLYQDLGPLYQMTLLIRLFF